MAKAVKDFVRNSVSSLLDKRKAGRHESQEYLHVENQYDSDEDGIIYPSEEMQRKSDGTSHGQKGQQTENKKSEKTSALQAAWNVLNLIQGEKWEKYLKREKSHGRQKSLISQKKYIFFLIWELNLYVC